VSRSRKTVLCFAAVVGVAACALLVAVLVVRGVVEASLWAGVLAALAGVVATGPALWPLMARPSRVPSELKVPDWVVGRPPAAGTGRCGSGMWPPGGNEPSSRATPAT
jgi:hypothetical protein